MKSRDADVDGCALDKVAGQGDAFGHERGDFLAVADVERKLDQRAAKARFRDASAHLQSFWRGTDVDIVGSKIDADLVADFKSLHGKFERAPTD